MRVRAHYTAGEVLFLLALSWEEARDMDAYPPDSLVRFSQGENESASSGSADPELPALVRRWDVHRVQPTAGASVLTVRGAGVTEREIGDATGVSHVRVHQQVKQTVDWIIDELGGPGEDEGAWSRPARCWREGGEGLKHLVPAVQTKTRRGRQTVKAARQLNLCEAHATDVATRLADGGMTPLDVALRMNLSPHTIRGWLRGTSVKSTETSVAA